MERKYDYSSLRNYVEGSRQWYLDKYGKLDWQWYDEGLIWAIQEYHSSCDFTEEDVVYLRELDFVPEDFIEEV